MPRKRREPRWLSRIVVDAIHADQLREHGGLPGIKDENALDSALNRPRHKWTYAEDADMASLAAAYAFGIARNHPYRDGNKRIAFLAMATFLALNGFDLDVSDEQVVSEVLLLASGDVSERQLAGWIRERLAPASRGR